MYKHMIPIMATVRKWRGKICLAFLFRVSLVTILVADIYVYSLEEWQSLLPCYKKLKNIKFTKRLEGATKE